MCKNKFVALLALASLCTAIEVPIFEIEYGEIKARNTGACTIKNDDLTYNYDGFSNVPGLWFGLIEYHCSNISGYIVSRPKCKPCGLFCIYNEKIIQCNQVVLPFLTGCIMTTMILGFMTLIFRNKMNMCIDNIISLIIARYTIHKDNKKIKATKRLIKHGVDNTHPNFKALPNINNKHKRSIIKNRMVKCELNDIDPTGECTTKLNDPSYIELFELQSQTGKVKKLCYPMIEGNRIIIPDTTNVNDTDETMEQHKEQSQTTCGVNINTVLCVLTFFMIFGTALGCDSTLFLHSNGKICDSEKCNDMNMYTFSLSSGSIICFNDLDQNVFKISIYSTDIITTYKKIYRTSEYELVTKSYTSCVGHNNECWRESCNLNVKPIDFENITDMTSGHGCIWSNSGCGDLCWHGQRCNFYQWFLKPIGLVSYVYKDVVDIWQVKLKIEYRGSTNLVVMNVNNPSIDLVDFGLDTMNKMPIVISSFNSETVQKDRYLLDDNGIFYNINAADQNMPERDIVGDMQLELFSNRSIYNSDAVSCIVQECFMQCTAPKSKLNRFRQSKSKAQKDVTSLVESSDHLTKLVKYPTHTSISIVLGNIEFNNLKLEKAHCLIQSVYSYACKGCNKRQYIVIQPYKIIEQGIMTYTSNCTFSVKYFSCSSNPYKIFVNDNSETCWIYIGKTNQTLYIHSNVEDLSTLDPTATIFNEADYLTVTKEFISSKGFITGLVSTVSLYGILTVSITLVSRIIKLYIANKNIDKIENTNV